MEEKARALPVEPPLGHYPGRVDEKGRLKLPVDMQRYLGDVFRAEGGTAEVFVTTLDMLTIRIYPRSAWNQSLALLEQETELAGDADDLAFLANAMGGSSEIDSQGRLLMPTDLRRELNVENEPVWLHCHKGRIDVYPKAVYEERRQRSRENALANLQKFERKGLK